MAEDEDWAFRPVMRGMLRAESLVDGTVDLEFLALCNEAIDVEIENQHRLNRAAIAKAAQEAGNGRR